MKYALTAACLLCAVAASAQTPARPAAPTTPANAAFERLKTLVGDWESKRPGGVLKNSFTIFGEGSALLHLEKPPGRQDVITILYPVGDEVHADHYCYMENQPRYVAKVGPDPNVIAFEFKDISNLSAAPGDAHMHSTTWKLIDADHMVQEWHVSAGGKEVRVNKREFTRVK